VKNISAILLFLTVQVAGAQQPVIPPYSPAPQYRLNLIPKTTGKEYVVGMNARVTAYFNSGIFISGKISGIQKDTLRLEGKPYRVSDLIELRYNPGTIAGVAAAVIALAGVTTIAVVGNGGKDGEYNQSEETALYTGIALTAAGGLLLIPTYFAKKKFSVTEYRFETIRIN
jgi:hypothetical protein